MEDELYNEIYITFLHLNNELYDLNSVVKI